MSAENGRDPLRALPTPEEGRPDAGPPFRGLAFGGPAYDRAALWPLAEWANRLYPEGAEEQ
ncbi:hypothetical protein GCM10009836_09980 [Pseudonocardia ailaonensis]|uniref:Uncharacterized protein n=1 Tax=Pseudonocardia ailaonensis TaxID=367279 RepID=A0ABN2MP08_9PSEU